MTAPTGTGLPIEAPIDAIAIASSGSTWSYGDLAGAADALATGILTTLADAAQPDAAQPADAQPADASLDGTASAVSPRQPRIAHAFELCPEGIVAVHAVARAGAILAPAHVRWTTAQAEGHLEAIRPDAILVSARTAWPGVWRRSSLSLPGFHAVDLLTRPEPIDRPGVEPPAGTDVLISTSGTEGRARSVCHSWAGLRANAAAANCRTGFVADDGWLATLAWAHVGGLAIIVRAVEAGARVICGPRAFDPAGVATALEDRAVTHVSLVPVMLERLLDAGASVSLSLRCALIGGGPASAALVARAREAGWPVWLTYGLTEAGSQVATAGPGESNGGSGRPLDGFEVRIADDGEIQIRGDALMLGYLEPPAALDPQAWLATGDFGELSADGRLRVTGRRSSRIVTGGTNVDPSEIEDVLSRHPTVRQVCVVGTPDDRWGEVVTAVVVPRAADAALESRLDAWVRDRLGGPRLPRRWRFVEHLPQTPSGKVDRNAVRAAAIHDGD